MGEGESRGGKRRRKRKRREREGGRECGVRERQRERVEESRSIVSNNPRRRRRGMQSEPVPDINPSFALFHPRLAHLKRQDLLHPDNSFASTMRHIIAILGFSGLTSSGYYASLAPTAIYFGSPWSISGPVSAYCT
ncbi:hypothetical protein ASPTUDRAFT_715405 [Aspergillus tubingensis CBS 134.48]|uniref:Uncharacterized protein n=1 Tax=Aspergillus tubingensis (strain CBS 134.48) TaxID=767770 RepID=A0A1L9N294_ASPTC|nr:hypothetical protein ASPTUDRAFT_715405 [Aspergillus tubingensis CBS 134.48]